MNSLSQPTNQIKCIIVDDDPFIQDLLQDKLTQYFKDVHVVAVASSGQEGIEIIESLNPDLIFLDVEMSDMTGFEMLSRLDKINFKTIFITSYNHYAIKAIRFNALDYLLKPFDLEELKNALARFQSIRGQNNLPIALKNLNSKTFGEQTLILNTQQGELHFALKDIIYIEGDGNYSYLRLTRNRKELVSKTLCHLEELLDDKGFFRCHKSYLINKIHIASNKNSLSVLLSNGTHVTISRRKKESFKNWINT